jgi:hypothetical protein
MSFHMSGIVRAGGALIALALVATLSARADSSGNIVIKMEGTNGSGESGTATLKPNGNKTVVIIKLAGGSSVEQPAHFHTGTCDHYEPRPLYGLNDVVNGASTTTVNQPIDKLTAGNLIINVHKSYDDIATQTSCGVSKS